MFTLCNKMFCIQQYTKCMYNPTMRRVRVGIAAVENKGYYILCVRVYSLRYPVWKAHAPCYIVICGLLRAYNIFPHYLAHGTIFGRGGGEVI